MHSLGRSRKGKRHRSLLDCSLRSVFARVLSDLRAAKGFGSFMLSKQSDYYSLQNPDDVVIHVQDAPIVPMGEKQAAELNADLRQVFRGGMTKSVEWRRDQLQGMLRFLVEREKEIFAALAQDLNRNWQESFMEVNSTIGAIKLLLKHLRSWTRAKNVGTPLALLPGSSQVVSEPYGVVLVIGAWNYPINVLLEPVAGAIAAGNAVVMKPAELAPAVSACLAKWLPRYLDSEAVRVAVGGVDASKALLEQRWDKIFYTGGPTVGKIVMGAAAKHLTPVSLELGGKNPCYIDATVDLKTSARRILQGRCYNAGQICIAPEYLLAHESVVPKLIPILKETLKEFYGPDPKCSPDFARIVSDGHFKRVARLLGDPVAATRIIYGGQTDPASRYVGPTLLQNVPWDCALMKEECFAPILAIQTVRSEDEAISIINDREKPLVLYVFTNNSSCYKRFVKETSSGSIVRNDCITQFANPHLPFGGVGTSGMGRYHGKYSFQCFSHEKAVFHKWFLLDMPQFRYAPRTASKDRIFSSFTASKFVEATLLILGLRR